MKLRAATTLLAGVVLGVVSLALPDEAQAGFGRRGSAQSAPRSTPRSSPSRSSASSGGSGGASSSRVVRGSRRSRGDRSAHRGWSLGSRSRAYPRSWGYPAWGYGFGYVPAYPPQPLVADGRPLAAPPPAYADDFAVASALAGDFTAGSSGPLLGVQLSIEGERLGALFGYTAAFARIAGTPEFDTLHLLLAHLTYAVVTSERARVRAELGLHVADAPLATFVAPGVGLSAVFGLAGPLAFEARVFGNAWPYTQLDARAGLALSLGSMGLGAGVRALYLNDNGALGAANAEDTSDTFIGPYVTLAVAL